MNASGLGNSRGDALFSGIATGADPGLPQGEAVGT
jgi:hypothetical protein